MPDQHRAPLQHALDLLTQHANPALHDQLNTWLTCGGCIVTALQAAQPAGGRAVVSTIFALQARLQGNSKPPAIPEQALAPIAPALESIAAIGRSGGPPRLLLTRWLDVFADRLTMPRYGDPRKRRLQARVLLGDTLRILADETPTAPTADDPLDTFCEIALTFWDIVHAPAHIDFGWNRIEASTPESMGGYFALGETPHPPTPEDIHAAAQRLLFQLSQSPPPAQPAALAPWLGSLHTAMSAALTQFAQTAAWPAWVNHAAQLESLSLFARLKSRLKRKVL